MKKYFFHSLALVVTSTIMCGFLLPFVLSLPFHSAGSQEVRHERNCYFESAREPYLLLEDAYQQADKIAYRRGLRLDKLKAMITKNATTWPLQIFPSSVNVDQLNHELDWPQ